MKVLNCLLVAFFFLTASNAFALELLTPNGNYEKATCEFYYTEPVTEVCYTVHYILHHYVETDQYIWTLRDIQ